MGLRFAVGDQIVVNTEFVTKILEPTANNVGVRHTLEALGLLGTDPVTIADIGKLKLDRTGETKYFVRAVPKNIGSSAYNSGKGVVAWFTSEDILNRSFMSASEANQKASEVKTADETKQKPPGPEISGSLFGELPENS
jgi:hypothetical protein